MDIKKNVFITGGAKRIGAKISEMLAAKGCNLIIHYNKSSTAAQNLCKKINQYKKSAICVQANLCKEEEIKKAFKIAKNNFGYIDCLINNASLFEYDNLN